MSLGGRQRGPIGHSLKKFTYDILLIRAVDKCAIDLLHLFATFYICKHHIEH